MIELVLSERWVLLQHFNRSKYLAFRLRAAGMCENGTLVCWRDSDTYHLQFLPVPKLGYCKPAEPPTELADLSLSLSSLSEAELADLINGFTPMYLRVCEHTLAATMISYMRTLPVQER